ncbi:MAG TPA: chemotaxis protein CheB [Thermoanaerobaculia bacterium]|nr:chemotaxis protein CheB [Thermoanaerobaculia bacterium]
MSPPEAESPAPSLTLVRVVAIAASAGGLAALTHVLSALPADFPAPILVLQHLTPDHRSFMAEILDRRGGTVIVQDEASSAFFGMPGASIRTGMVDRVLPLTEIAPALVGLTREGER